ncbi:MULTISPECIES: DUF2332 domain-containing protein [unclassified Haladaptatus]|uniref:DUF2332 domain-containing protein n=1 Tax=unclassified Haladaptatus TaxID=2622732 RepID=UPI0023E801C4|nr:MULTISPECIES: DUF2332 domain-containing protein [unclassified Haladaptatus]
MTALTSVFETLATREARDSSPLYESLAHSVAADPKLLALAGHSPADQPAPNLLFAAVQYLLFNRPDHPLAAYFSSIVDDPASPAEEADQLFREFCLENRATLVALLGSRRVQTNVLGRSSILLPVFEHVSHRTDQTPLGLVEIGCSAGLNLLWDRYGYEYGGQWRVGDPAAPLQLSCDVRNDGVPPLPESLPAVGSRLGINLNTLSVENEADVKWLRALIWPEHESRRERIEAAVSVARESPPELVEGDALADLKTLCNRVPEDEHLCIYNTHVLYQFTEEQQADFAALVADIGQSRDLFWANCEWHGETPEVRYVAYENGEKSAGTLAAYEAHGRWIDWHE